MKLSIKFILASVAFVSFASCSKDPSVKEDTNSLAHYISESEKLAIPAAIELPANPAGYTRIATFYADGVQKYKAQLKDGSTTEYQWVFVAPQANLYDVSNKMVGTHSAGPDWQLTGGADSCFGQAMNPPHTAPSSDPTAIDWLLLVPKTGKTLTGIFANVSYIQRIATTGGKAPATAPVSADQTIDVPYTAIYRFTKMN